MAHKLILPAMTVIGENALSEARDALCSLGKSALIVAGSSMLRQGHVQTLTAMLEANGIASAVFSEISGEPTDEDISRGLALYRERHADFLIGFGGGSQLDAAKAIGILVHHPAPLSAYMGKEVTHPVPPLAAIPSTAGTGSEATPFTIITDTQTRVKMLLKGPALMPALAVIDPAFSARTPRAVSVSTGLDAFTHAVEAFTSRKAFPQSDLFALSAMRRIFASLPRVLADPDDRAAREQMALAAYEAGVSFSNASVTVVHGMSRPIGALFHVPHGLSNAMLLSECLACVADGARPQLAFLARELGFAGGGESDGQAAEAFLRAVEGLCRLCGVPTLKEYGIDRDAYWNAIEKMAGDAMASGSPANTRKPLTAEDLMEIYRRLWK